MEQNSTKQRFFFCLRGLLVPKSISAWYTSVFLFFLLWLTYHDQSHLPLSLFLCLSASLSLFLYASLSPSDCLPLSISLSLLTRYFPSFSSISIIRLRAGDNCYVDARHVRLTAHPQFQPICS